MYFAFSWESTSKNPQIMTCASFCMIFFRWVILALSWFLSTNRKWSPDAVQSINGYFHMTALAVPCALGLTVLMWRKIDTDELSGMCGVGNANRAALLVLILVPLLCYLFTGGALAVCGLISSLTVRELMRSGGQDGRIQKVIWKIGSYSLLFIVAIAVLASSVVAQLATWNEELPIEPNAVADPAMFIRVFLPLFLSILSSWWIFSRKTLSTWQKFGAKLNPCRKSEKIAPVAPVAPSLPRPAQGSVLAEPLLRSYSDNTPFTPWQTPATSYLSSSVMSSSMGKKWIQSPPASASDNVWKYFSSEKFSSLKSSMGCVYGMNFFVCVEKCNFFVLFCFVFWIVMAHIASCFVLVKNRMPRLSFPWWNDIMADLGCMECGMV